MAFTNSGLTKVLLVTLISVTCLINGVYPSTGGGLAKRFTSTCETIPAEIHLTKDEYDQNSVLVRTCEANVAVNKCEGACASSIQPSALSTHGFQKECSCCRESSYRERPIVLASCFDGDGQRLTGILGQMEVTIQEPTDCKCHECSK